MASDHDHKIMKLNGTNYHNWVDDMRSYLILKDLWDLMNQDILPANQAAERTAWHRAQKRTHSLIYLPCERDQAHLCADVATEELFGKTRKKPEQTMDQWISHIRALASQLRGKDYQELRGTPKSMDIHL